MVHYAISLVLLVSLVQFSELTKTEQDAKEWSSTIYDYIVVGAGSAGSAIASRLTELPNVHVLLLEIGQEPVRKSEIPLYALESWPKQMDWSLPIEEQTHACLGLKNKAWPWVRGKALGGSSSINAMVFTRGNRYDYDRWAEEGNEGWAYDDLLPIFKKIEDYQVLHSKYDAPYHNKGGPISVSRPMYASPLVQTFLDAGQELGYHEVDYNAEGQTGYMRPVFSIRNGTRWGTYKGYLEPNKNRKNLHIVTGALGMKVTFDSNKKATGVLFEKDSTIYSAKVKEEVILSGGSAKSPQLLMLSGIGPKDILEKFNIPIIHELEGVGKNLQDHVGILGFTFKINRPVALPEEDQITAEMQREFQELRAGPLTVPAAIEGIAFVNTRYGDFSKDWPDMEFMMVSKKSLSTGMDMDVYNKAFSSKRNDMFTLFPILQRPVGVGHISLKSSDPNDVPIYQPKYLVEPQDAKVLIEGTKMLVELIKTKAFQRYQTEFIGDRLPGCEKYELFSDDYIECFVRHYTMGFYHMTSSCRMGNGPLDVVDSKLRVYGVKGLRVADASIMPYVITGHTNVPSIMIGEKLAEIIKKERNQKKMEL